MKQIFPIQILILYIFVSCILVGCSSDSKEPEFNVEGEWLLQKSFKCTDEKTGEKINKHLLESANKGDKYILTLKDGSYLEKAIMNYGGEEGTEEFSGKYILDEASSSMTVTLEDPAWTFTYRVFDPNLPEIFAVKQSMTKEDIERFYIDYLRLTPGGIDVPEGATGELTVIGAKITN